MSRDQKVMTFLPPIETCLINFYHRLAFTAWPADYELMT